MDMTPDMFYAFLAISALLWFIARACETGCAGLRKLMRGFLSLPWAARLFVLYALASFAYYGGSKPSAPAGASSGTTGTPAEAAPTSSGTLNPAQFAAGFAHVSASTNPAAWHAAPSNAVVHAPWTVYGVAEDTFWLPADGWSFVIGTNHVDGLHVSSSGLVSFRNPLSTPYPYSVPEDAGLLAPLHGSLGTVPPQGRFWHALTASNSLLLAWENVYVGRDTNSPVSCQAELFPNGDFTYRYAFTNVPALTNFAVGAQHNGGGETYALNDTDKLANGLELRWRAFGMLDPDIDDHDGDGISTYEEVVFHGTCPSMTDTDGDGLEDAAELTAGAAPLNPDSDGDFAADSIDPDPLTPRDPGAILNCCSNIWLFHVHHALPTNATCGASGFPHDHNLFAVTVTLNAPVAAPGAVLWVGGVPLVMCAPGSWTLWLDKTTNQAVRLCAPRGVGVDYTVSSDEYGFFFQPTPPVPAMPPLSHTDTLEGAVAVPFFAVEPSDVCFHGAPVTFRAAGCAAGLSGLYEWTYGNTTVVTNAPEFTVLPDFGGLPWGVSVTFMPDGLDAGVLARAAAGAGARSAADGWPAGAGNGCGYCRRHVTTNSLTRWWCDLTGKPADEGRCPAAGRGYIPPANGTNTFFTLPVPRRPASWPDDYATLSPWPSGHGAMGTPPDPDDCGHGAGCTGCEWAVDHWHRKEETFGLLDHSGCCACPEHNPAVDGETLSLEPVVYEGAVGLTAAFRPFYGDGPVPLAAGPLPGPGVVTVTGLTPSAAPHDRSARFSRFFPWASTTCYEVDRFTVLSLDLQADVDLSGAVDAGDAAALAAAWDREWLIPAGTNAFPLKVFNDVALPGVYTLAVDGPSNVVARYGNVTVRGGESNAVAFPPGSTAETVQVQADGPGEAALTLSFKGSGAAAGFECETQVSVKAYGVELDDGGIDIENPALNGIGTYVPGSCRVNFINGTNVWQTAVGASFPQTLELTLPHLGTAVGVSRVELALSGVSQLEGWCVNGRFASGSQTGDDFSFAPDYDLRAITVLPEPQYSHANLRQVLESSARLQLFCKDTGGRCVLTATPYDGEGNAMPAVEVAVPPDANGNGIADAWERDKVTQHNGVYPSASIIWSSALYADPGGDDEPAALGARRTDGTYSHADTGDGLSVLDEYRGYLLDGGAGLTGTRLVRLSPALKELLVQVNELPGMAQQDSLNPAALSAYSFNSVMQQVAQFYCHPTRGLGIDLYWCRRDFTVFGPSYTPEFLPPVEHLERFSGETWQIFLDASLSYVSNTLSAGQSQIRYDNRLLTPPFDTSENLDLFRELAKRPESAFLQESRDPLLGQFVKLVLVDRRSDLELSSASGPVSAAKLRPDNAKTHLVSTDSSLEGAHVCVASMSDEGVVLPNVNRYYTANEFVNELVWAVAHELGHLLIGAQHYSSSTALMTNTSPAPYGIPLITAESTEIHDVNLKNRHSTSQGELP